MCYQRISTQTIYDQYQLKCPPGENYVLMHESKLANLTTTMADLDTYKDKIIVFEAVKASESSRLATRQPLQPTNTQISSPTQKPAVIKPSFDGTSDGASDENYTPPSAMSYPSFQPSRVMHAQVLHPGIQSSNHSLPPASDDLSQPSPSHSHTPGDTFRHSTTLPHSSVGSRLTPHSEATTPLSASDHAVGSVSMADFDRYYNSWHDRFQVSYPDYNDGMHVFIF